MILSYLMFGLCTFCVQQDVARGRYGWACAFLVLMFLNARDVARLADRKREGSLLLPAQRVFTTAVLFCFPFIQRLTVKATVEAIEESGRGIYCIDEINELENDWRRLHRLNSDLLVKLAEQSKQEPSWIVNDLGELGVQVGKRCFFLYKGDNIEYADGRHDNGDPMLYRPVGKREFGDVCYPVKCIEENRRPAPRYTVNLTYYPGLSFGKPEDGDWRPLPGYQEK